MSTQNDNFFQRLKGKLREDELALPTALAIETLTDLTGSLMNAQAALLRSKPRYSVDECLLLLGEGRKRFYSKVRSRRYSITKDGGRTYMTHAQLLDAAEGDTQAAA